MIGSANSVTGGGEKSAKRCGSIANAIKIEPTDEKSSDYGTGMLKLLPNKGLCCVDVPLTNYEPFDVAMTTDGVIAMEKAMLEMGIAPNDAENKDPLDFIDEASASILNLTIGGAMATDKTAAIAATATAAVVKAKVALFDEQQVQTTRYGTGSKIASLRSDLEMAKNNAESASLCTAIVPSFVSATFDPNRNTWTVDAHFVNNSGDTAHVEVCLARHAGILLLDSTCILEGYPSTEKFEPNLVADKKAAELNATSNQGAALQSCNNTVHGMTCKVPAWACGTDNKPFVLIARWVLMVEDAEEGWMQMPPLKTGDPPTQLRDIVVYPPLPTIAGPIQFRLNILPCDDTSQLGMPSRAAAELTTKSVGHSTFWVSPCMMTDSGMEPLNFLTMPLDGMCLRFRFEREPWSDGHDDDMAALLAATTNLAVSATPNAEVSCYHPIDTERCVAVYHLSIPLKMPNGPAREVMFMHLGLLLDGSGSMFSVVFPNSDHNKAISQVSLCGSVENIAALPETFKAAGILGPTDEVYITVVHFHSGARTLCKRAQLGVESSPAMIKKLQADIRGCSDTGGTCYTPAIEAIAECVLPEDNLVLAFLTDGQAWDTREMLLSLEVLKKKVLTYQAIVIAYGEWLCRKTAMAIETSGYELIVDVGTAISCKLTTMLASCVARQAMTVTVDTKGCTISQTGDGDLPCYVAGATEKPTRPASDRDLYTEAKLGLGTRCTYTVVASHDGKGNVTLPEMQWHDEDGGHPMNVHFSGCKKDLHKVLASCDPLYAPPEVRFLNNSTAAPDLNKTTIRELGMYGDGCLTSETKKIVTTHFGDQVCILGAETKAVAPDLFGKGSSVKELADCQFKWVQPKVAMGRPVAPQSILLRYYVDEECPSYSLGLGSVMCEDEGDVVYRSLGTQPPPQPQPPPPSSRAPARVTAAARAAAERVTEEVRTDPNAVLTHQQIFEAQKNPVLQAMHSNEADTMAGLRDAVKELTRLKNRCEQQSDSTKTGKHKSNPMDTVQAAIMALGAVKHAHPTSAELWRFTGIISSFLCKYRLDMSINMVNEPLDDSNCESSIYRMKYLILVAEAIIHKVTGTKDNDLYRATITATQVEHASTKTARTTLSLKWEVVDALCHERGECVTTNAFDAALGAGAEYYHQWGYGGYHGGTFPSMTLLYKGPFPPANIDYKPIVFPSTEERSFFPSAGAYMEHSEYLALLSNTYTAVVNTLRVTLA
tara:strand:- start:110 stop:3778 length:3669 start_codon:yes stop_codon:yes gene_type:complete